MQEEVKNIEIQVAISSDINEANFILAPQSAKNMNEIYAANLEEKIGNQIKAYKEDVDCALEIVKKAESTIEDFKKTVEGSKNKSDAAEEKVIEIENSLSTYAKNSLGNLSPTGKALITSYVAPSTRAISLTLGESGTTYTAPSDGWIIFAKNATSAGQSIQAMVAKNNLTVGAYVSYSPLANRPIRLTFFAPKGATCTFNYTAEGETTMLRFLYAEGTKGE